ncbi:MAG: ATP-binding protein [Syntrophales bacterium]|nr:ATP-binding protein [Syntrophales bacterium]
MTTEEVFPEELAELRARLREAEETLEAIRSGAVDAIVVSGETGEQVYTLQGADQSYRLLVESISEGALTLAANGTVLYANRQFANMLGLSLDQIIGTPFLNYVADGARHFDEMIFSQGNIGIFRYQEILKTGVSGGIPVQISLGIADMAGERIVTAVITDLTEQIRYREIANEERLLRSILEQDPDGVAVCNFAGRIIRCSRALKEFCHEPPRMKLFDDLFDIRYASADGSWERLSPIIPLRGVSLHSVDGMLNCPDGQNRYVLISAIPLSGGGGEVFGCLIVLTEITERKEMEVRLAEQTARLQEQGTQLLQANKELESFSYSVSHDLRAPLRAIDGYSKMILRRHNDSFDDDAGRLFNLIRHNTEIMEKLIDDLLAFSRMGRKELHAAEINMHRMLSGTWEELQDLHPHRRMTLKINDMPPGWGDASLIKQVLTNILANAVKFTRDREEAIIEAGTCIREDTRTYYIRDNGVGFDMQYGDRLFNVFQRLHGTEEFEGTGVGLAIVHRIIKRHGGRVWAEGEVGKGACFYFSLPARID